MNTHSKPALLFLFLLLAISESLSQPDFSSTDVIIEYKDFSLSDFERIEQQYHCPIEELRNLYGIALVNNFEQVQPKLDVRVQFRSNTDSIVFVGAFQNDEYCEFTQGNSHWGKSIYINYVFSCDLRYLYYQKKNRSGLIETILWDKSLFQYLRYEGSLIYCQQIDKKTGTRVEGSYRIVTSPVSDTVFSINLFDYTEWVQVRSGERKKTGIWKTFDSENNPIETTLYLDD